MSETMTTAEVAELAGITLSGVRWAIESGRLPAKKVRGEHGEVYQVRRDEAQLWIAGRRPGKANLTNMAVAGARGGAAAKRYRRIAERLAAVKSGERVRVSNKARGQARRLCRLHLALRDRDE